MSCAPHTEPSLWLQSFGGYTKQFKHMSQTLGCEMKFTVFFPPNVEKAPILYYLSGLTCTDRNVIEKVCHLRCLARLICQTFETLQARSQIHDLDLRPLSLQCMVACSGSLSILSTLLSRRVRLPAERGQNCQDRSD